MPQATKLAKKTVAVQSRRMRIAMLIAVIKATMVAWIFMHLKWDKMISIWWLMGLSAVFFVFLMCLPVLTVNDHPPGVTTTSWSVVEKAESPGHEPAGH